MLALSVACTAAAVVWAYLVIGHGGYWRTGQRLPPVPPSAPPSVSPSVPAPFPAPFPAPSRAAGELARWPDVAAVIPARNEAAMLPAVLPTLLGQDYPGALTVILVDDCSTDGTAEVAAGLGPASRSRRARAGPCGWWPAPRCRPAGPARCGPWPRASPRPVTHGATARVRAVHRRRHRLGGRGAAGPGARGGGGRPGPGLADGAAADGDRMGAGDRSRVRVLLRPAVPVPAGELASVAHGGGRRRLHARAPRGPGAIRRAGPDQRRPHR